MEALQPQPPQPQPSEETSGDYAIGISSQDAQTIVANKANELAAYRRQIIENARAKLKEEFRATSAVPAPPSLSSQPAQESLSAPPVQQSQQALAEALTAQLGAQLQAAKDAQLKAEQAEAKLNQFLANPPAYLKAEGLDLDTWNARLLNGGTPTPEERLKGEVDTKMEGQLAPLVEKLERLSQEMESERRGKALNELTPILTKDFPLVEALLGPEQTLEVIRQEGLRAKREGLPPIDPGAVIAALETRFLTQYKASLQKPSVATKLGVSVSPQQSLVAESPQTLSNRVVSSVASSALRPITHRDRIANGRAEISKQFAQHGGRM